MYVLSIRALSSCVLVFLTGLTKACCEFLLYLCSFRCIGAPHWSIKRMVCMFCLLVLFTGLPNAWRVRPVYWMSNTLRMKLWGSNLNLNIGRARPTFTNIGRTWQSLADIG